MPETLMPRTGSSEHKKQLGEVAPRLDWVLSVAGMLLCTLVLAASEEKDKEKPEKGPAKDRVTAGKYAGGFAKDLPSVLLRKQADGDGWQRVARGATVHTADTLVALPGYAAVVNTSKGAELLLHGHVRDFSRHHMQEYLGESAVQLHKNDKFDLDMTLLRGRVYLRNRKDKGPLKVRLRFDSEVWDLTLADRNTEVGVDLFKVYTPDIDHRANEEPRANLALCLFDGEMDLKVDDLTSFHLDAERPKAMVLLWDSVTKAGRPVRIGKVPDVWDKRSALEAFPKARQADVKRMTAALKDLEERLSVKGKGVDAALKEALARKDTASRVLAVYCLGAIDDAGKLIDVLADEKSDHWIDRSAAIYTLRRWLSQGGAQGKRLHDTKTKTGILSNKKYKPREAETIQDLLHDFSPGDWRKPETFEALARCLQHRRVAIAELAFYHLAQLSAGVKLPSGFNAAASLEDRERYVSKIEDMIAKKKLPPPLDPKDPGKKREGATEK
jgi:hypothetical protein